MLQSFWLSLHRTSTLTLRSTWIGFDNYAALLRDPGFWTSFANTLIWTASAVTLQLIIGVAVALLMHGSFFGRAFARGLILFPYLLPTAVSVLVWRWLFNDLYGFLNFLLLQSGVVEQPVAWLSAMPDAMISIVLVGTWKFFPFVVIAVLARLQSIPLTLYEAAKVDGASRWSQFTDITLPQIAGVLAIVVLLRSIWDFKEFDLIYLMTGGGPGIGTQTLPLLVYRQAFQMLNFGRGAAVASAMCVFMLLFFAVYAYAQRHLRTDGR
jgi:multiple sugar transport system permease protein